MIMRRLLMVALALAPTLSAPVALARAGVQSEAAGGGYVTLAARDEPINAALQDIFGQSGISVTVSSAVQGRVNGNFRGTLASVFGQLRSAFNLIYYRDGNVIHVLSASEISSRSYALDPSSTEAVRREAVDAHLLGSYNRLSGSSGLLVANGDPVFLDRIDRLVRSRGVHNATDPDMVFRVFYLRYAWANDTTTTLGGKPVTMPGVATILRQLVAPDQAARSSGNSGRTFSRTRPKLNGQGMGADNEPSYQPMLGAGQGQFINANARGNAPQDDGDPLADRAEGLTRNGGVRIEADPRLNAIIVRDRADRMRVYDQLIRDLDVEPQLLEIQATIVDIDQSKARQLGINWQLHHGNTSVGFGGNAGSASSSVTGSVLAAATGGLGISTVIGTSTSFAAQINALATDGVAKVISNPQLLTLSDVQAVFDNSRTFYVQVAGAYQTDLYNVSSGTTLTVTPHVFRDKGQTRIRMLININDGGVDNSTTVGSTNPVPEVTNASINTQAMIVEGQSMLIGGMVSDSRSNSVNKVPLLGDVPVLGKLFQSNSSNSGRSLRMFLITPRLVSLNAPVTHMEAPDASAAFVAPSRLQDDPPRPAKQRRPAPYIRDNFNPYANQPAPYTQASRSAPMIAPQAVVPQANYAARHLPVCDDNTAWRCGNHG